jgi:hypothetical protein
VSANTVAYNPEIYTLAEVQNDLLKEEFRVVPNPASDYVTISFIPKNTGSSKLALFSIDGKKISEIANGVCQAGMKYQKKIDVSKLISGVYIIHLRSEERVAVKKIIISR